VVDQDDVAGAQVRVHAVALDVHQREVGRADVQRRPNPLLAEGELADARLGWHRRAPCRAAPALHVVERHGDVPAAAARGARVMPRGCSARLARERLALAPEDVLEVEADEGELRQRLAARYGITALVVLQRRQRDLGQLGELLLRVAHRLARLGEPGAQPRLIGVQRHAAGRLSLSERKLQPKLQPRHVAKSLTRRGVPRGPPGRTCNQNRPFPAPPATPLPRGMEFHLTRYGKPSHDVYAHVNVDTTKKPAGPSDWHRADIKAALEKKGWSLRSLSIVARVRGRQPARRSHKPWPRAEQLVAEAIGVPAQRIWPSRYRADGTPKSGRGERGLGRAKQSVAPARRRAMSM
jgi:Ner family transcriptional regulator